MHPHPFPALIEYEKYPEATYFSKKETKRNIENFKWIIEKGKQYGVDIYLYFRNIHYPPEFAKKHSLKMISIADLITAYLMTVCLSAPRGIFHYSIPIGTKPQGSFMDS